MPEVQLVIFVFSGTWVTNVTIIANIVHLFYTMAAGHGCLWHVGLLRTPTLPCYLPTMTVGAPAITACPQAAVLNDSTATALNSAKTVVLAVIIDG